MTTIADVRRAVQPLLQRNPDLALIGRLVVVKPVHHVLRGIYIDRSLDPLIFTPTWAVVVLFEPGASFDYNWAERLYNRAHGAWDITNPATSLVMCEEIERIALPILRPVQTIDDFVAFTSKERFSDTYLDLYPHHRIFVDVARGDLDAARALCAYFATDKAKGRYGSWLESEHNPITKKLCPLIAANDRPGLVQFLRDMEAYAVQRVKLQKLWEPTPFPLEAKISPTKHTSLE